MARPPHADRSARSPSDLRPSRRADLAPDEVAVAPQLCGSARNSRRDVLTHRRIQMRAPRGDDGRRTRIGAPSLPSSLDVNVVQSVEGTVGHPQMSNPSPCTGSRSRESARRRPQRCRFAPVRGDLRREPVRAELAESSLRRPIERLRRVLRVRREPRPRLPRHAAIQFRRDAGDLPQQGDGITIHGDLLVCQDDRRVRCVAVAAAAPIGCRTKTGERVYGAFTA